MNLKPLVISFLDDDPKNRPTVIEVLREIKKVKKACSLKQSLTDVDGKQQSTHQSQEQQEQLPQRQGQQHKNQQEEQQKITPSCQEDEVYSNAKLPPSANPKEPSYPLFIAKPTSPQKKTKS